jgi:hypothetical protein
MNALWLKEFMDDAVSRRLCTRVACTTCGAQEFRGGLKAAISRQIDVSGSAPGLPDRTGVLVVALAALPEPSSEWLTQEEAMRCVLFDLWRASPAAMPAIEGHLEGSWAGRVLNAMQQHHARLEAVRREREAGQAPAAVALRRDSKRRRRQEQHERRLAAKRERDRTWRESRAGSRRRASGDDLVDIRSRDYWFKIVEFLQQNWALIDPAPNGVIVWFFGDTSGVFDQLTFASAETAAAELEHNGFRLYATDKQAQEFIACPQPPFRRHPHPNGLIYSSGRFWTQIS